MVPTHGDRELSLRARVDRALARCLEWSHRGEHRRVLAEVERLLALSADDPHMEAQLLIWKSQALLAMGHAERAFPAASRSWHLQCSAHACHLMATALHALGDSDQAEKLLQMGLELFRDAVHLPMQLAMMLADQGRMPEAIDVLDRVAPARELSEDLQVFLAGLRANLLATVGRWSEAEAVLEEGLGRHPDSPLLLETHDSLHRERRLRRAERALADSWRASLEPLDGVPAEVDEAVIHCGAVLETPELVVLAARRVWRAYLAQGPVRLQTPDPWATALVVSVLELDGRRPSAAALARATAVNPSTVRSALRRLRGFLADQDPEVARRAFGVTTNPRLDQADPRVATDGEVVRFPGIA